MGRVANSEFSKPTSAQQILLQHANPIQLEFRGTRKLALPKLHHKTQPRKCLVNSLEIKDQATQTDNPGTIGLFEIAGKHQQKTL